MHPAGFATSELSPLICLTRLACSFSAGEVTQVNAGSEVISRA